MKVVVVAQTLWIACGQRHHTVEQVGKSALEDAVDVVAGVAAGYTREAGTIPSVVGCRGNSHESD
jgi:hypothetical protein